MNTKTLTTQQHVTYLSDYPDLKLTSLVCALSYHDDVFTSVRHDNILTSWKLVKDVNEHKDRPLVYFLINGRFGMMSAGWKEILSLISIERCKHKLIHRVHYIDRCGCKGEPHVSGRYKSCSYAIWHKHVVQQDEVGQRMMDDIKAIAINRGNSVCFVASTDPVCCEFVKQIIVDYPEFDIQIVEDCNGFDWWVLGCL